MILEQIYYQMWRTFLAHSWTAALYLGFVLSHLVGEGSIVKSFAQPGQRVSVPCSYHYEDHTHISQLSVQWRSPHNELLCHYIKHKAFQNCTVGYAITYTPGSIALTIQQVRMEDYGTHVCSVSKRHEFSDYSIELVMMNDSVTSAPTSFSSKPGQTWRLALLHTLALIICI